MREVENLLNSPALALIMPRLEGIRLSLIAQHIGGTSMPSAVKGTEREYFIRNFLESVFPNSLRFGDGSIIDTIGNRSGQLDIVIESSFGPSLPMPGSSSRLYFAETVSVAISVKSALPSQWEEVMREAQQLNPIRKMLQSGMFYGTRRTNIPLFVFCYKGWFQSENCMKRLKSTPLDEAPMAIFSADPCYYCHFDRATDEEIVVNGPSAILALIIMLHRDISSVGATNVNLFPYLTAHEV